MRLRSPYINLLPNMILVCLIISTIGCKPTDQPANNPHEDITAQEIMQNAHRVAGGESWVRPKSLYLDGYGLFYSDGDTSYHESHKMWRVYESKKDNAHVANGKVRIESIKQGNPAFLVSYDGQNTYDMRGKQEQSEADKRWASNFGYGVIRHSFDDGYRLDKLDDGMVRDSATYRIKVIDPEGGETIFDIRQIDYAIVKVGFDTPRGWHERIYSEFFHKAPYTWNQPGRVELFYNSNKSNEIYWTDFDIDKNYDDELFVINPNEIE